MTRKTIHVDSHMHEALRTESFQSNTPITQLVRLAVEAWLSKKPQPVVQNQPLNSKSKKQRSKRWSSTFSQTLAKGAQQ